MKLDVQSSYMVSEHLFKVNDHCIWLTLYTIIVLYHYTIFSLKKNSQNFCDLSLVYVVTLMNKNDSELL